MPTVPSVSGEALADFSGDLILLTGAQADGLLPGLLRLPGDAAAESYSWLLSVFGDRLYVEICRSGGEGEAGSAIEAGLLDLAYGRRTRPVPCMDGIERSEAPLVATTEVWYATEDRHEPWLLLKAISDKKIVTITGDSIEDAGRARHHLRGTAEMRLLFADLPEAFENAANVARRCAFKVGKRKPILPPFECGADRTEEQELRHQAEVGLEERLLRPLNSGREPDYYRERLNYELAVIQGMGFPGYFLIVSDFIKWAKAAGIPVGPGRGSGAGSVVAWALTITDLDPLEFGLLFERFLNPERVSMPDFDIDFCEDRRSEVIEYVKGKYGSDLVAMIATFGKIKAKSALKDAGRVISHSTLGNFGFGEINDLTKVVPDNPAEPKTLSQHYADAPEFREKIDSDPKYTVLMRRAIGIEGLVRQVSTHAAGVVIGDRPLHQLVPVHWSSKDSMPVVSFDLKSAEAAGLVKFDFLGLTTLSIIKLCLDYIREFRGTDVDISAIPRDDAAVYRRLGQGYCTGVFQLEGSTGMIDSVRMIDPVRLEDLIATVALYRPGPMDQIKHYADRKKGIESFGYPQPEEKTKPFLAETYGIMVYQEQVMQVAQACAGYSMGGADLLRRAMGKKDQAEMQRQRHTFAHGDEKAGIPGAIKLGMDESTATDLFDQIAKFADYGFNKSHAAAYAWLAYQTAWLKVNYPAEFLAALMSYNTDKPEKLALIKDELDELGIPLLVPDINRSHARFRPEAHATAPGGLAVRFGLTAVKGISGTLSALVGERASGGDFATLEEFHRRAGAQFNKTGLEKLSEAGAFDGIAATRREAATVLGWLNDKRAKGPKVVGQGDLLGTAAPVVVPADVREVGEWGDVMDREYKAVGFYVTSHPIDLFVDRLKLGGVRRRKSTVATMLKEGMAAARHRKLCFMVDEVFMGQSKKNGKMFVRATVSERADTYPVFFFQPRGKDDMPVETARQMMEAAKNARRPMVAECSITAEGGDQTMITCQGLWDVDDFLKDIRGNFRMRLDPRGITLEAPEAEAISAIDARLASGAIGPEAHAREVEAAYRAVARRRIVALTAALAGFKSQEGPGSSVAIHTPYGVATLKGYDVDGVMLNALKAVDGADRLEEYFGQPQAPAPEPAASAAAAAVPEARAA